MDRNDGRREGVRKGADESKYEPKEKCKVLLSHTNQWYRCHNEEHHKKEGKNTYHAVAMSVGLIKMTGSFRNAA